MTIQKKENINIIYHKSAYEIVRAFYNNIFLKINKNKDQFLKTKVKFNDLYSNIENIEIYKVIDKIRKFKRWGFFEKKNKEIKNIHLWFIKSIKRKHLIELISHELAHFFNMKEKDAIKSSQITILSITLCKALNKYLKGKKNETDHNNKQKESESNS